MSRLNFSSKPYSVRVAMIIDRPMVESLDPASIKTIYQAMILINVYGQLIEYDQVGQLVPSLASRFQWEDNELTLQIPDGRTVNRLGKSITAADAAASIRRILKLGTATHLDLSQIVCGEHKNIDILEDCEGVKVSGDLLKIRVRSASHRALLTQALATIDFGVIPIDAIDIDSLKIKDLSVTSGPYYLDFKSDDRAYRFIQNSNSHHDLALAPQVINLVPANNKSSIQMFLNDEFDVQPTLFGVYEKDLQKFRDLNLQFELHKTLPIKLTFLQFSLTALRNFTANERLMVGYKARQVLLKTYPWAVESEETDVFLGPMSFGALSEEEMKELKEVYLKSMGTQMNGAKVKFYFYNQIAERLAGLKVIPELELVPVDIQSFFNEPLEKRLDLVLIVTDTAFQEDAGLLGYNFSQGTFGVFPEEGRLWMQKYMNEPGDAERASMVQQLQFKALKMGAMIPIMKSPYTALTRNGYTLELSPLFARTQFWRIRKYR